MAETPVLSIADFVPPVETIEYLQFTKKRPTIKYTKNRHPEKKKKRPPSLHKHKFMRILNEETAKF
jgi:hypothetical protein